MVRNQPFEARWLGFEAGPRALAWADQQLVLHRVCVHPAFVDGPSPAPYGAPGPGSSGHPEVCSSWSITSMEISSSSRPWMSWGVSVSHTGQRNRAEDDDRLLFHAQSRPLQRRSLHTQPVTEFESLGNHTGESTDAYQDAPHPDRWRCAPGECLARDLDESLGDREFVHLEKSDRGCRF